MTEDEHKNKIRAIKFFIGKQDPDYWYGFYRGCHRRYHGEIFGTEAEHANWMSLQQRKDSKSRLRGIGYQAGLDGMSIAEAIDNCEKMRKEIKCL